VKSIVFIGSIYKSYHWVQKMTGGLVLERLIRLFIAAFKAGT